MIHFDAKHQKWGSDTVVFNGMKREVVMLGGRQEGKGPNTAVLDLLVEGGWVTKTMVVGWCEERGKCFFFFFF